MSTSTLLTRHEVSVNARVKRGSSPADRDDLQVQKRKDTRGRESDDTCTASGAHAQQPTAAREVIEQQQQQQQQQFQQLQQQLYQLPQLCHTQQQTEEQVYQHDHGQQHLQQQQQQQQHQHPFQERQMFSPKSLRRHHRQEEGEGGGEEDNCAAEERHCILESSSAKVELRVAQIKSIMARRMMELPLPGVYKCEWSINPKWSQTPQQHQTFLDQLTPSHWDQCERCTKRDPRGKHIGIPFYSPLGVPRAHMVPLIECSDEYQNIKRQFQGQYSHIEVQSIHRVQNIELLEQYERERRLLAQKCGSQPYERKDMFHTSNASLDELILEGLDARLSSIGLFGRGIYATDDATKASSYWKGASEVRTVFAVSMLLGRMKVFPEKLFDHSLVKEPYGYDSVMGCVSGQNEYIVYRNSRVLINYAIRYVDHSYRLIPAPTTVPAAAAAPITTSTTAPAPAPAPAPATSSISAATSTPPASSTPPPPPPAAAATSGPTKKQEDEEDEDL